MPYRNPRYLRMFTRWFKKNHYRFLVPVTLQKINARKTELVLPRHPIAIEIVLWTWSLSVHALCDDQHIDFLLDLECAAVKTREGYQCKFCDMPRQTWPTLEALYADRLYEPFLKWVNEKLRVATGVAMYETEGSTWAELIGIKRTEPRLVNLKAYAPFSVGHTGGVVK